MSSNNMADKYQYAGPNIIDNKVIINSLTLKVEKENAKAMIEGYQKFGTRYHITIFTARSGSWSLKGNFHENPKLLTTKKHGPRPKYPLSQWGIDLRAYDYNLPLKYLVFLDSIYHIKYNIDVWKILCTNDIFDIWKPTAPYNMLKTKRGSMNPVILLLRIFEIEEDFEGKIIEEGYSHAVKEQLVTAKKPIITNKLFKEIKNKITVSIADYIENITDVFDTTQIKI